MADKESRDAKALADDLERGLREYGIKQPFLTETEIHLIVAALRKHG